MRKLTLESGVWHWQAGKSNVVIKSPDDKKTIVDFSTLTGWSWTEIQNAQWDRYFSIKPSCIREYIEKHLVTA